MSKVKTNLQQFADFKRLNKVARETYATRRGFADAASYMEHVKKAAETDPDGTAELVVSKKVTKTAKKVAVVGGKLPIIHVVDVVDRSGSMSGEKLSSAILGVNQGVNELRKETDIEYKYTLCTFDSLVQFKTLKQDLSKVENVSFKSGGTTALFDAIGMTIGKIENNLEENAKVLVNIYTDGAENASLKFGRAQIAEMIKEYEKKGFTFSFIGTPHDTQYVINTLNIDASNTLSYDGTGAGLKKSMTSTFAARSVYSKNVKEGKDVTIGFYKNIQ